MISSNIFDIFIIRFKRFESLFPHKFIIISIMYTTTKKSRMLTELDMDIGEEVNAKTEPRLKKMSSIEGRVVALCLTTWYFGYVFTEMSPLSPTQVLQRQFGPFMGKQQGTGPCFGLVPFGAAIGVVMASCLMSKLTRRSYLIGLNLVNLLVTGLIQTGNVYTLYIFRIMQGVLVGNFMTLIPAYIAELTPKEYGSRFAVYPQISVVLGVLVSFSVGVIFTDAFNITSNSILTEWQYKTFWRVQLGIPIIPSIIQLFLIAVGYIPESLHSLILKNRKESAHQVISLFYMDSFVDQVLAQKQRQILNRQDELNQNAIKWTKKGYIIGIVLSVLQVMTGIASFVTQAGHVMAYTFQKTSIGLYTPILITISQLVGTLISVPMLKYFQWRKMTIIGGFTLATFDALIAVLFYLYQNVYHDNTSAQNYIILIICICIMGFMFTFGMTLGSSVWAYISFMMPSKGVTVASVINWLLAGCSIIAFSFVTQEMISPYVMMFIYCGATLILSIVFTAMSVNIKGLTAKKVQLLLE